MATFAGDDAGPVLGIDLGTTFSCVAVYDDAEKKVNAASEYWYMWSMTDMTSMRK